MSDRYEEILETTHYKARLLYIGPGVHVDGDQYTTSGCDDGFMVIMEYPSGRCAVKRIWHKDLVNNSITISATNENSYCEIREEKVREYEKGMFSTTELGTSYRQIITKLVLNRNRL